MFMARSNINKSAKKKTGYTFTRGSPSFYLVWAAGKLRMIGEEGGARRRKRKGKRKVMRRMVWRSEGRDTR